MCSVMGRPKLTDDRNPRCEGQGRVFCRVVVLSAVETDVGDVFLQQIPYISPAMAHYWASYYGIIAILR